MYCGSCIAAATRHDLRLLQIAGVGRMLQYKPFYPFPFKGAAHDRISCQRGARALDAVFSVHRSPKTGRKAVNICQATNVIEA